MSSLANQACQACGPDARRLSPEEIARLLAELPGWQVVEREGIERLERLYRFKDFKSALAFTNRVGALAEEQGHHPALLTEWGKVTVTWWTHALNGLHYNDFVMAAKTDGAVTGG
ncbi:MAG: 4a-hydroxytetrahydrobiopterin dehydratase [Phycisphaerae bacterium]